MCEKGHKYARLNDHEIFCQRCGDVRPAHAHQPVWWAPYTYPFRWYPPIYWTWSDTGGGQSVQGGTTTYTLGTTTVQGA